MSIQRQGRVYGVSTWKRLAFAVLTAFFCVGSVVWALSSWGVVGSAWSTIISISFVGWRMGVLSLQQYFRVYQRATTLPVMFHRVVKQE